MVGNFYVRIMYCNVSGESVCCTVETRKLYLLISQEILFFLSFFFFSKFFGGLPPAFVLMWEKLTEGWADCK